MRRLLILATPLVFACPAERPDAQRSPSAGAPETAEPPPEPEATPKLEAKVAQFAPAKLSASVETLPESEREALKLLIEASRLLDPVFDRQAWAGNPALAEALEDEATKLAYFRIMRGPWDRQDHHAPFAIEGDRPPGAGFYPEDLDEAEFKTYVTEHPKQKAALESLFTLVQRDGRSLKAVPYSEAFAEWLEPAAQKLEAAAAATRNDSLARFLKLRAAAFRSDDYYESDKAWMDLDSRVEVTIGPYETYEDKLLGLKASYESFVTVSDPKASSALAKYKALLPAMEQNLPVPHEVKTKRGAESPIRVVDLVFTSGDARKSVQTIAFNLPNDERVRKEKGAKKVLLRNLIQTKFEKILRPIAAKVLVEAHQGELSSEAFFDQVLFHELSHSLGPAFTEVDGEKMEVRLALGASYSPLEECKADVMGAYNVLFMIERGELPKDFRVPFLSSYFAGLFRSVRFGTSEAHGKGAAVQLNRYLDDGAVRVVEGRFAIDHDALTKSNRALLRDILMLQHEGDKTKADALLADKGVLSPPVEAALKRLDGVPVDIRPIYPLAGEG
ncbi:MAG: hypothetical protein AAGD10_01500 [Myxococcota bacterium]